MNNAREAHMSDSCSELRPERSSPRCVLTLLYGRRRDLRANFPLSTNSVFGAKNVSRKNENIFGYPEGRMFRQTVGHEGGLLQIAARSDSCAECQSACELRMVRGNPALVQIEKSDNFWIAASSRSPRMSARRSSSSFLP